MGAPSARQDLLEQLTVAIREESASRKAAQEARARQLDLIRDLRGAGLPYMTIALHVAKAQGKAPSLQERKRIAQQLRQQASRVTRCHSYLRGIGGDETTPPLSLVPQKEMHMAKLIKRVTTEEFIAGEDETLDGIDETGDDELDEADEEEEEPERSRPRRK